MTYKVLLIGLLTHYEKIPFNESFFSKDNELSFYWAGMLAADGCLIDRATYCLELYG